MTNKRSFIFGGLQIGLIFCTIGSLVVCAVGAGLWQAGESLFEPFDRSGRGADLQPLDVTPVAFQVTAPTPLPGSNDLTAAPADLFPAPIPRSEADGDALSASTLPAPIERAEASSSGDQPESDTGDTIAAPTPPDLTDWLATRLVIPEVGLDAPVVLSPIRGDTWDVSRLTNEIGHLERTASPGSASNIVLAGHVTLAPDGRAGPFKNLKELTPGDLVTVYKGDQNYTYRIDHMRTVKPNDIEVTYPTNVPTLTLITCLNYNRSLGRYEDRLVIVGHLEH
jgi:LPXTG-site transpeptidase (sortase) family protein